MKRGAFNSCPKCNAAPRGEEDLAISLGLTDHFFDRETISRMAAQISSGAKVELNPEMHRMLINSIRSQGISNTKKTAGTANPDSQTPKKSWWKFF